MQIDYLIQEIIELVDKNNYYDTHNRLKDLKKLINFNSEIEFQNVNFVYWKSHVREAIKKYSNAESFLKATIFISLNDLELLHIYGCEIPKVDYCLCWLKENYGTNENF